MSGRLAAQVSGHAGYGLCVTLEWQRGLHPPRLCDLIVDGVAGSGGGSVALPGRPECNVAASSAGPSSSACASLASPHCLYPAGKRWWKRYDRRGDTLYCHSAQTAARSRPS